MRRALVVSCIALVGLATLSAWVWHLYTRELATTAELRAALSDSRRAGTLTGLATVPPVEASAREPPRPPPAVDPSGASAPTETTTMGGQTGEMLRDWLERERRMMRDPAYRDSWRQAQRERFVGTRANAIRVVGMTEEQADRVVELWIDRNLWFMENSDLAIGGQLSEAAALEAKRRAAVEQSALIASLGEAKYDGWQHYLQTASERATVEQFNSQLTAQSAPMSLAVADALVEVLSVELQRSRLEYREYRLAAGATDAYANQGLADRQRYLELMREGNRRVHDAMAGSMTALQLERLHTMLERTLAPAEAALRIDSARN